MFYLSVVLEEGQIVDRGLDPQNEAELIVELQRNRPHGVFDPCALDADIETIAHFALIPDAEPPSQKGGDVVGLHRMDRGPGQIPVNGRQIGLPAEDDVGGVFALIHTPVVLHPKGAKDGAISAGETIQSCVNPLRLPPIDDLLGAAPVRDPHKRVVQQLEIDIPPA